MVMLQFSDRKVTYDSFITDVATKVVELMNAKMPERISQRQAYKLYGRGNVERWLRKGKLHTYKRPGKVEYITSELIREHSREQDYLDTTCTR